MRDAKFVIMKRAGKFILLFLFVSISYRAKAQKQPDRPKLIIGIVVDQMRYDYLYRYWDKYSQNGFKRLLREGFAYSNTHYNYMPTYTGPGHASIYTGTTPAYHGIAANNWFDRKSGKSVYCVSDTSVRGVGTSGRAGMASPHFLKSSTITDELRFATNYKGKVIGISIKDRSAILPAGHNANAAFWFDSKRGNWVSSSFYMHSLPVWVVRFNNEQLPDRYLKTGWKPLLPITEYTESTNDDRAFEQPLSGEKKPVFPHLLEREKPNYGLIPATPWGNKLTGEFAKEAILNEDLGKDEIADFLCVSFSSTDYVGHNFGPNSIETEDTYLRLDRQLSDFLDFLDKHFRKNDILLFLTADHGGAPIPEYQEEHHVPSGRFNERRLIQALKERCREQYGDASLIRSFMNQQIYLDDALISKLKLSKTDVVKDLMQWLYHYPHVRFVYSARQLQSGNYTKFPGMQVQNGYFPTRSGDIMLVYDPGFINKIHAGTTHGSPYAYDTHVPLLFWGWNVRHGESYENVVIPDIATTLAALLHISEPNAATGQVLSSFLMKNHD